MRSRLATLVAGWAAALSLAPLVAAADFGVTEDATKSDPHNLYAQIAELGMTKNVVSVTWNPDDPTGLPSDAEKLDVMLAAAQEHGVKVVFAVYQQRAAGLPSGGPVATAQFATWLQNLARRFPSVREYIGPNEPNQPRFWQPQFAANCTNASARAYFRFMAAMYDALKAVDPGLHVAGAALSPRGNDNCRAKSNVSTSPVRFVHYLGRSYRASGRKTPIMDAFSFHPYPNRNTDSPAKGYAWPNVGLADLDRLKQAIWDAFAGTGQPTVEQGLKLTLNEIGWQTATQQREGYTGAENVPAIDEATQARFYADVVRRASCDPAVASLDFFHLVDEPDRDRFQSGLVYLDGSRKASFGAVKEAIAAAAGRCLGRPVVWRHATKVAGALADFGRLRPSRTRRTDWSFRVTADEEANYRAGVFRLGSGMGPGAMQRSLAARPARGQVLGASGLVRARYNVLVRAPRKRLAPGRYVYAVRFTAAMNPSRTSFFVSAPFTVR